jgi:UDP-2,4-diacetamido-2,4,6-trideoxy-beta-L-altropyranose hydrolase
LAEFSGYRVAFRVDGGGDEGFGSISRCYALAEELEKYFGCKVAFFSNIEEEPPWGRIEWTRVTPPEGMSIWQEGRWLSWEAEVGEYDAIVIDVRRDFNPLCKPLIRGGYVVAVIDETYHDLIPAHIVINPSVLAKTQRYPRYNQEQMLLLGPDYLSLRSQFDINKKALTRDKVSHLVVSPTAIYTPEVWGKAIEQAVKYANLERVTILGLPAHNLSDFRLEGISGLVTFHNHLTNPAEVMASADIALCGGGLTLFEYIALGVPAVAITNIPRQVVEVEALASQGACIALTHSFAPERVGIAVKMLAGRVDVRRLISAYGPTLIDGKGRERVALTLAEIIKKESQAELT